MKLIPIYLFMALFLGFVLIYTIRNEQYFIIKDNKNGNTDTHAQNNTCDKYSEKQGKPPTPIAALQIFCTANIFYNSHSLDFKIQNTKQKFARMQNAAIWCGGKPLFIICIADVSHESIRR